jgi:hypothetical protein
MYGNGPEYGDGVRFLLTLITPKPIIIIIIIII